MRPPHCAGEIISMKLPDISTVSSFNEAPALRGGNRGRGQPVTFRQASFNEAPALRGGNQGICPICHRYGNMLQ